MGVDKWGDNGDTLYLVAQHDDTIKEKMNNYRIFLCAQYCIVYTWFLLLLYANSIFKLSIFQAFGGMLLFNLLMLCLAGVIVEGADCCFYRDCSHNMYCKDAKFGCSAQKKAIEWNWSTSRDKIGTCVNKQGHGSRVGYNSDAMCTSGEEQCAYCSDTCGTSKGCNVVPQCNWDTKQTFNFIHTLKYPHYILYIFRWILREK